MEYWILGGMFVLGVAIVVLCAQVYIRLLKYVCTRHGRVNVEPLGLVDALLALLLIGWLGGVTAKGYAQSSLPPVTEHAILMSAVLFGLIVGVIVLFLRARNIPVLRLFGLRAENRGAVKMGAKLFLAAMPLVFLSSLLVQWIAGSETEPQEIIKYFSEAARRSEVWKLLLTAGVAVIAQPLTEEFIFRGYLYGVIRRYFGVLPALLFTSAFFALIHLNVPAILPLFVLAIGLTLAYEVTGSLLAPMLMHALFNASMLGMMFYISRHP